MTSDRSAKKAARARMAATGEPYSTARRAVQTGHLGYKEAPDVNGLLREPDEGSWDLWSAPMSMREVEEEILLQLDTGDRSVADAPAWSYERSAPGGRT